MQETTRIADEALEERLGYRFSTRELLERALTHSSAVPELRGAGAEETGNVPLPADNERLEFLGDAVLELLASEYLLCIFPEWSEGQLSKSRSRIVNAGSLEAAARRLRIGEHLRLGRGEEKTGGRDKQTLLADAFEAVVAAIYLDAGLGAARSVLRRVLFEQALEERGERIAD
jgi:ribonuclease-3